MGTYAAIDIGTNTLRLLIAEAGGPPDFAILHEEQEITRLGEGLRSTGLLQPEARRRSLALLRRFADMIGRFEVDRVAAVGTSALREARNGAEFADEVERETGLALRVIDASEEARLTLLGVHHGLRLGTQRVLVMDVGGGSTEFILADGECIRAMVSTGLGVVKLTEAHLSTDPPTPAELDALEGVLAVTIERLRGELPGLEATELIATAGTATTLAAIDLELGVYDRGKVHGHWVSLDRIAALFTSLARMPRRDRSRVRGLEPGRADVILAGAAILVASMERLGYQRMRVSDAGLREGVLLDLLREGRRAGASRGSG
jgi:exopolyphosphatase/guanosine-5'-triphosphate,3'-diphosphate pyrophosphatase